MGTERFFTMGEAIIGGRIIGRNNKLQEYNVWKVS